MEHELKPSVYVETSVISYLTAKPSRDIVIAGRQRSTIEWWETAAERFELVASTLVESEAAAGDPDSAKSRLEKLAPMTILEETESATKLVQRLVAARAVPLNAEVDAVHIAIAATNGVGYLVTWNYRHIANAAMRTRIDAVCLAAGFEPAIICSPEELMEPYDGDKRSDRG